MKKKLLASFAFVPFLMDYFSCSKQSGNRFSFFKTVLFVIFFFMGLTCWSQPPPPHTLLANGTIIVPAGIIEMDVQAWGGGGAGGGASGGSLLGGSRGGAGGGGGAYAHSKITTVAGTTLSVLVAPTTTNALVPPLTGNAVNGADGGNSTITGFETVIFAAGGKGGTANNAGGTPAGGEKGLDTNSKGSILTVSGKSGANGSTGLIGLLQVSGAGGDAGGTGGGLGGTSINSLLFGSGNGNPGGVPGGGGGGAMDAYAHHSGGSGASGKVIVTYTCPNYAITGVSAAPVCTTSGTSEVTLSGLAAGLPTGIYTVSYKLGNPGGATNTIPMTVSTAGTGKFTISGFGTPGTNRITITNLTSGVCSSNITITNNFSDFTIYGPSVAGTIGAVAPICSGATSPALSLTGNTGQVLNWESSIAPFTTWTSIGNTTTSLSPGTLNETTQFRAVVKNGPCSTITSTALQVTVNPLPQGNLTANGPFCVTGSGMLTFTSSSGTGPFTLVYKENGGANQTKTGVISGTAFAPTTGTVTATTTYTLVSVTDSQMCVRSTGFTGGGTATITVNPLPQGSLSVNGPFCDTGSPQITFTSSAGTGPFTIVYKENGGADQTKTGVVSGTAFVPTTGTITATTTYTLVSVTDSKSCPRSTGFTGGGTATITVNPLPQGNLTANGPFCVTGSGMLTFTSSSGTGPFTLVYKENGGANQTKTGVISGTAFAPTTGTVTATTTYTLVSVTDSKSCPRSSGFTGGGTATITVNPLPQGSLSANGPFCDTGSGMLTFTSSSGTGPFTIVYKENGGANQTKTGVVSGTAFAPTTGTVTTTTTYTLVSITDSKLCLRTSGFSGSSPIITVNSTPTPTFVSPPSGSVCANTPVTYTTQSGQTNYVWTVPGVLGTNYNILSGATDANSNEVTIEWLTIGNKTVTVKYTSNGCAAVTNASNTITIIKTERGVVNGGQHICIGDPSPLLTLNSYIGTIVRWEYAEALPYVWQPIAHTGATYQPGILTTSTSYRAIVKNGICSEDAAIETRIDVDSRPNVPTLGAITQPTCSSPLGSILLNGLIGTGNWTINQTGSAYQTYNGSGGSFTVPNLAPGNYTFTINENSGCPSLSTISFEIKAPITNTWNGTVWSEGREPIMTDAIVFSGNYQTTGNLGGCSCMVNSGVNVTVNSNHTLTITNSLNNNGGTLTFENNASLYQTTNAVNTGNIIYKRNTQPIRRFDFTYWSSPVKRTPPFTMHDLSPGTLLDKYNYYVDGATASGWVFSLNGTQEMLPAVGYTIRAPQNFDVNNPVVYPGTFIGVPNNGPYTFGLAGADKWNLIGNPYPSAVYADQFIFDNKDNLFGTLYFWTHNSTPANTTPGGTTSNYSANDYSIYNLTGSTVVGSMTGTGATTPGNNAALMGYIAAGQSFFVVSKTAGNAVFNNGMRVPGNNSQFFKNSSEKLEKHRVWINLTNTQDAFKQLLIGYIEGATNKWDTNYDAVTMDANPYLDFYSINEDKKLVVQGRAIPFEETDIIPLGYRSALVGDFTIAIDYADGKLSTQPIFLEDKTMNVWHDLRASDYTFSTVVGTFTDRFLLHFTGKSLGVDEFENAENNIFISVKDKSISIKSTGENLSQVLVFDISGKMLYQKNKIESSELQIANLQSGNQVLLVKTILESGNVLTKKIVF